MVNNYTNASVLPYYKDKNETYFIFARSANWKGQLTTFGGTKNKVETDPMVTASRKCAEKACHMWGNQAALIKQLNPKAMIINETDENITYLAEMSPKEPKDFNKSKSAVLANGNFSNKHYHPELDTLEIVKISQTELLQSLNDNPHQIIDPVIRTLKIAQSKGLIKSEVRTELFPNEVAIGIKYENAALFPYSKDADGNIFYYLAKEFEKQKLTTFGGGKKPEDKDNPISTATRECAEESLEVWGNKKELTKLIEDPSCKKLINLKHKTIVYFPQVKHIDDVDGAFEKLRDAKVKSGKSYFDVLETESIIRVRDAFFNLYVITEENKETHFRYLFEKHKCEKLTSDAVTKLLKIFREKIKPDVIAELKKLTSKNETVVEELYNEINSHVEHVRKLLGSDIDVVDFAEETFLMAKNADLLPLKFRQS